MSLPITTTEWEISRREAIAENGMVAAKHPLAAEAGVKVLQEGGNAVDAAITTALAMGVLEPYMNGIGGGGFMLYHDAKTGENHFLDYFMCAPRGATPDMYELVQAGATDTLGYRGVKDDENYFGPRSVGVPGMVAGAAEALKRFGTISLSDALQPAIRFAAEGVDVTWYNILMTARQMDLISRYPATAEIYLKNGRLLHTAGSPGPADRIVQSDLAKTLTAIAEGGADAFYRGPIGQAIGDYLHSHGNPMDAQDLANYRARWVTPRSISYRDDYQLVFGPSTGGTTLAETFNILEGFEFSGARGRLEAERAEALHLFIEAARIAYADRWAHLADEETVDVPWRILESKAYARERRAGIDRNRAAEKVLPWQREPSGRGSTAAFEEPAGGCTTHLSVIDKDRNMVAITQTINQAWGSGVVVPGTGVLLNDTMVLFDPNPGNANSIAANKRPLSSMTPMLVLKQGKPFLTVGAPGGRMIMGTIMKVIHNIIDHGMGIQEACARQMVDASSSPILVDSRLNEQAIEGLRALGHKLEIKQQTFVPRLFASPTGILVNPESGRLHGGADPFHPGIAAGF
jgi:gamma-glutamyltranspeptidase/glutathione hydrolase